MKKNLFLFILGLFTCFAAEAKKIMFTVDMSSQSTKNATGIHVMGDFQAVAGFGADWTPNTCLMTQDLGDTNLYHFTVDIPAFAKYEFKYLNGDQSYEVEVIPLEAQVGYNFDDNRWFYADSLGNDTLKLPAVRFSENSPLGKTLVRFRVDMTTTPYNIKGVHAAGSFQSNDPSTLRLYSFGSNLFEIISYMDLGTYSYKYYDGNTLADSESVPAACASVGMRPLVLTKDTILNSVCFSSCSSCYPLNTVNVTTTGSCTVYPNPTSDNLQIHLPDATIIAQVTLRNLMGQTLLDRKPTRAGNITLSLSDYPDGLYVLEIRDERGHLQTEKIHKQ